MGNGEQNGGIRFSRTVTVGNIITMVVLLVAYLAQWFTQAATANAAKQEADAANAALVQKVDPTLDRLNTTMELLDQRLKDYPLHRHVNSAVIYPPGQEPREAPSR